MRLNSTIVVYALAIAPAFSTQAELPSHLRRLDQSNASGHQGGYGHEGGHQGGYGHEGGHQGGYGDEEGHQHGHGQDGGHQLGHAHEGGCGHGWYGNGGEGYGGGMHSFGNDVPELVAIQCNATDPCDLRDGEVGTWVCRSMMTDSTTEESRSHAICISNDQAWATDSCGCCKGDTGSDLECPLRPEFITIKCANDTQPDLDDVMIDRHGHFPGMGCQDQNRSDVSFLDRQFICRDHVNPFTGETQSKTFLIPEEQSMKGDTCGCCDGQCPFSEEPASDPLGSVEQAAVENSGSLTRMNGVLMFTMLAVVGFQSRW